MLNKHIPIHPSSIATQSHPRGFVLVATLVLLGLALTTVIIVTSLMRVESDLASARAYKTVAKKHALNALEIALGELQFYAGPDQVSTLPAATKEPNTPVHPNWTRIEGVNANTSKYLVSSAGIPDPFAQIAAEDEILLIGEGTVGNNPADQVSVEKVAITTSDPYSQGSSQNSLPTGYQAYWVGELNTRANTRPTHLDSAALTATPYEQSFMQLASQRRSGIEAVFTSQGNPDDDPDQIARLADALVDSQLFAYTGDTNDIATHYYDATTFSYGVLSNPSTGLLKKNLTDLSYRDTLITNDVSNLISPNSPLVAYEENDPGNSKIHLVNRDVVFPTPGTAPNQDDILQFLTPVISEFSLSVGIFHTQSDRRHRIRYHMYVEWLNPYFFDMGLNHERGYIVIADNLPRLQISNQSSGQSFTVDLNDFDENMSSNTSNESKVNSWMEFNTLSNPDSGFNYGIDGGSVYRMAEPDPLLQARGLARTIAEDPNRWYYRGATAPTTGPRQANAIYGNDNIQITLLDSANPTMDLWVIPLENANMSIPRDVTPDAFAQQNGYVMHLQNIPFEPFTVNLSGSAYSRSTSGSYTPSDNRIRFQFKLYEDADTLRTLANVISMRSPVLDFSATAGSGTIADLYDIFDIRAAASGPEPLTDLELFYDETTRLNSTPIPDETTFYLFDVPLNAADGNIEPVSPGVFAQIPIHQRPDRWVSTSGASTSPWIEVFDRYYFSGTELYDPNDAGHQYWKTTPLPKTDYSTHPLSNLRIQPILDESGQYPPAGVIKSQDGAQYSLMRGSFNIHSASVEAWTAVLKTQLLNNAQLTVSGSATTTNVFSRNPFSAPGIDNQLADSQLPETPNERNKALYRQGLRSLDDADDKIRTMAESITRQIQTRVASGNPFQSISDFVTSSIIDTAIADAELNFGPAGSEPIDPISPGFIRQSDILNAIGSLLTVRSDTFVIRAYGEAISPRSGTTRAKAYCEAIVQRFPQYVDSNDSAIVPATSTLNQTLGRRFKVVSFRWLQPHEI